MREITVSTLISHMRNHRDNQQIGLVIANVEIFTVIIGKVAESLSLQGHLTDVNRGVDTEGPHDEASYYSQWQFT